MEDNSVFLYNFVMYFLYAFKDYMTDTEFSILVSNVTMSVLILFVSGAVSATWGACGALASLRRSKRG